MSNFNMTNNNTNNTYENILNKYKTKKEIMDRVLFIKL